MSENRIIQQDRSKRDRPQQDRAQQDRAQQDRAQREFGSPSEQDALVPSDVTILDLLRKVPSMTVAELATAMEVTATAVRQRLVRLQGQGMIRREVSRIGRGRPSHRYRLTEKGRRHCGENFADLAIALWEEIRHIQDPDVRRGLLQRIAKRMAEAYRGNIHGVSVEARMEEIAALFSQRKIPFVVESRQPKSANQGADSNVSSLNIDAGARNALPGNEAADPPPSTMLPLDLPVLTALACPYPELAEQDRTICAMERLMFSEMVGGPLRLTSCRLDGDSCCQFESAPRSS